MKAEGKYETSTIDHGFDGGMIYLAIKCRTRRKLLDEKKKLMAEDGRMPRSCRCAEESRRSVREL